MAIPPKQISCTNCQKRSSCFNELSKADHKIIEEHRLELNFKAGEVICKQGSFASNIMFIYQGMVKNYLETPDGSHVILSILPSGNMIGLTSLFTDDIFHHSSAAIEDSIICSVDIKIFEEYTKSNGGFASEIINIINNCIIHTNDRFLSLSHKQVNGRFADAIIFLSKKVYNSNKFELTMMRKDLAELMGISPESVTRVITKFKNENIIKVTGKTYEIMSMEKLEMISNFG